MGGVVAAEPPNVTERGMAAGPCMLVAVEHLTLDGVYQAPARRDEDTRNGFEHGGWSVSGDDPKMQEVIGSHMARGWSLLLGRTTYDDLYEGWQVRQPASPMTSALKGVRKFVATRRDECELGWENSTPLRGEAADNVEKLKGALGETLLIFGGGALLRSLMSRSLVDELVLMIHPLVLGSGRRLFDGWCLATPTLSEQVVTATGVVIATYRFGAAPAISGSRK